MKRIALLFVGLFSIAWLVVACTNTGTTGSGGTGTGGGSATATPAVTVAATVGVGTGNAFLPVSSTITHGQAVVWNSTLGGHQVVVDNFSGGVVPGGGCGTPMLNTSSYPVTLTFPTAGTYNYHCAVSGHSTCSSTQCGSGCTGMVGSITVN